MPPTFLLHFTLPLFSPNPNPRLLFLLRPNALHLRRQPPTFNVSCPTRILPILLPMSPIHRAPRSTKRAPANCSAARGGASPERWASWVRSSGVLSPERILRLISGSTSSPICQFIEAPRTFLHSVDPRIKLVWLLALVVLPARSNIYVRLGMVVYLSFLSMCVLPMQIWMDQLRRVALLSGILFVMVGFGSDGVPSLLQSRTPPPSLIGLPTLPSSLSGYSYLIMKLGPLQLTRKGLSVASTSACLAFMIFQSASLCLATTTPEQLASAFQWFMVPLRVIGVPVAEIVLTLLLSLRFINMVFDEVRNAALGILARRIQWQQLTLMETFDIFFMYVRRIFKNIFNHAEQISKAMIARGFRGDSNKHRIYFFPDSSFGLIDILSLLSLFGLIGVAILSECALI